MRRLVPALIAGLLICAGCNHSGSRVVRHGPTKSKIVARARMEVSRRVAYDASFRSIPYPNGDVRSDRGACADVIVRAYRAGGYDLQELIHEDEKKAPAAYHVSQPDPNIDHRRCRNQMVYFRRHGLELTTDGSRWSEWKPGDVVYWDIWNGRLHTGIISDATTPSGRPGVIHNIGPVATEEDVLTNWRIVGHFRMSPQAHPTP